MENNINCYNNYAVSTLNRISKSFLVLGKMLISRDCLFSINLLISLERFKSPGIFFEFS